MIKKTNTVQVIRIVKNLDCFWNSKECIPGNNTACENCSNNPNNKEGKKDG